MAGKKRSRKSISQQPKSASDIETAAIITDAKAHNDTAAKSNRRKDKKVKPKTDAMFMISDAKIKSSNRNDGDVEVRTPKPKRRKLKGSEKPLLEHHGVQTQTTARQQVEGDPQQEKYAPKVPTASREFGHDEIVQHISVFLSGKSSPAAPTLSAAAAGRATVNDSDNMELDNSVSNNDSRKEESLDSISYLVEFLEVDFNHNGTNESATKSEDPNMSEDIATDVLISKGDVATLLLPWSVARLMRVAASSSSKADDAMSKPEEVAWRVLSSCFDSLTSPLNECAVDGTTAESGTADTTTKEATVDESWEALLSASLSQSTLNRLVPYAARISFAFASISTTVSSSNVQSDASHCFLHLARRFRPSLDNACNSLLREVDELVSSSMDNDSNTNKPSNSSTNQSQVILLPTHQVNVVSATLKVIHSLMSNANPKRLFGIICSMEVLPRLGRMKMVCSEPSKPDAVNKEQKAVTASAEQLVQSILWDGLLNPTHHVDGFRTMSELHTMPSLPKLSSSADTDQTMPDNLPKVEKGKSGGKLTCFQSTLFTSLQSLLSLPATTTDGGGEGGKAIHDAIATASILPIIVHGFFERMRAHTKRAVSSGGSTSEADAKLQFRFWCRAMLPALEQLFRMESLPSNEIGNGGLTLALLKATSETLGLVLEFDAYLPSYSDPKEEHLGFLECVTKGLLRYIDNDASEKTASPLTDQKIYALETSFRHILLLNHRLLHEKLANVISFACSCLPSSQHHDMPSKNSQANELLSSVVKTYRELRQVGYFLAATRGAFAASHASQGSDLKFMNNLLHCGNILESLSMAYQSCPSGQLHEIWEFFDGWIVFLVSQTLEDEANSSTPADTTSAATTELSFAVQMYIIFIKNIRADKQNSPELRSLCETSVTTSISKLLGKANNGSSPNISADSEGNRGTLMRLGFDLCGWLVDLHTRSCFWIESIDVDGHGSSFLLTQNDDDADKLNVLGYLRNVAEGTVSSEQFKSWKESWLHTYWQSTMDSDCLEKFRDIGIPLSLRGSLQRLALHRIHQLHSMIYYCNLQENERHASDLEEDHSSSQALTNEARMLVDFSLYIACSQITRQSGTRNSTDESSESLWSPVAQALCTWTHYSDPFHAELFLIWFFSTLCQNHPDGQPTQRFWLEKTITLTLARDASFYDVGEAMSLFMKVGVQFAFSRFIDSIVTTCKPSEKILQESSGLTISCMELAKTGDAKLSPDNHVDTVSTALSFLASVPLELALCNENLNLLDRVVGLDILSSQVIKRALVGGKCNDPRLLNIVHSTKIIIANILPKTLLLSSDFGAPCLANMTSQLSKSCSDFRFDDGALSAPGNAISEYFSMCVDYHEKNANMLVIFFAQMGTVVHGAADIDFVSNALLIRSVIRRMNILDRHNSLSKKTTSANASSYELCMNFVQETQKHLRSRMCHHIAKAGSGQDNDKVASIALLLASEIYSFFGNHQVTTPVTNLLTNEQMEESRESVQKVLELVTGLRGSQHSSRFIEASNYFLSSMATALGHVSPLIILENILEALVQSFAIGQESPLLDAAICSIIRNSDLEQTEIITTYVLRETDGGKKHDTSFIIKIFHLLMMCANSQEQHKYISGKCKTFLLISMGLLRDRRCGTYRFVSNVKLFQKTMTTLISKKELLLLSGREIAMICCEMNPLFHDDGANKNDVNGDVAIFSSCCSVVASLIANYPKQLYGCPSPLFSLLLSLLTHLLHANPKKGLSQKTLEYAKVCELLIPHKDIFKKHVVGLILCYIQVLNKGMNPTTKSRLMPSIYALLDMCSEFETRQINAMIDVPSKTVFAPVFQSYQKFYQYHGQA